MAKDKLNWEDSIKVRVDILNVEDGCYSRHVPASEEDYKKLMELKDGGMSRVAHSLLIEAMKREVYLAYFSLGQKEGLEGKVYDSLHNMLIKELPNIVENFSITGSND